MAASPVKILLTSLALAVPRGYQYCKDDYELLGRLAQVEKSPGYAPAVYLETGKVQWKGHYRYRVRYGYEVEGRQYRLATRWTDQEGLLAYTSDPAPKVVYSTADPSVAVDLRYFTGPHGSVAGTALLVLLGSFVISLGHGDQVTFRPCVNEQT
jgi:hypothetical protein